MGRFIVIPRTIQFKAKLATGGPTTGIPRWYLSFFFRLVSLSQWAGKGI
jgi:hypothetical protein